MYGEQVLARWLLPHLEPFDSSRWIAAHALASLLAVSVLTYLHIVIGEMLPKALALQRAERTVLYVSPIVLAHPDGIAARGRWVSMRSATGC